MALIDVDKEQRIEDAITIGYAMKLDDPAKLRPKKPDEIDREREAAISSFMGM
jgi:hypothetical protein